jgi:hypothetical protein
VRDGFAAQDAGHYALAVFLAHDQTMGRQTETVLFAPAESQTEKGEIALPTSAADFGKLIAEETEKWGKVIRAANIKPES